MCVCVCTRFCLHVLCIYWQWLIMAQPLHSLRLDSEFIMSAINILLQHRFQGYMSLQIIHWQAECLPPPFSSQHKWSYHTIEFVALYKNIDVVKPSDIGSLLSDTFTQLFDMYGCCVVTSPSEVFEPTTPFSTHRKHRKHVIPNLSTNRWCLCHSINYRDNMLN